MGFSSYFLIVWDLIKHARDGNIRVGPGRGSAAGCAVAYTLQITDLDPIEYDLLFERFLNPSRISMPDIDMDFDSRYRDEMIRYAAERYGRDHVAQIVTFSTIKARAAVRDAARVLGYPYAVGDKVAKAMPPLVMGRDTPLYACFEEHPKFTDGYKMATDLREMYATDPDARQVIDVARGLEGLRRQDGIHAAAVVITKEPLTEYLPIQRKPEAGQDPELAPVVTQYEMHGVEELGLLKMDFLGLRNLDVHHRHRRAASNGPTASTSTSTPSPSTTTRRSSCSSDGDSIGVFQLEGGPMRVLMRSLAPTSFEDVAALVALYRPGPMSANMHNDYADRKNGRKPIDYLHDDLAELLGDTYGLMIYQESVMRMAQKFAGYSLADADNLRKACGKKNRALIAKEREKFVAGCEATGYGASIGTALFDIIEPFADYAFNKSHSYGYGYIAYQTAYLKAHYPVEYIAALLTSVKTNLDKAAIYLNECRQMGIEVLVPDVNVSESDFAGVDGPDGARAIAFGMSAVRNVGEGLVALILAEREANGPFLDFYDFCDRVDTGVLNKRTIESLIKAGGFDALGLQPQGPAGLLRQDHRRDRRPPPQGGRGPVRPVLHGRRGPGRRGRVGHPLRHPRRGLRQAPAPRLREGDARALRLRPPAHGGRGVAAAPHRVHHRRSRGRRGVRRAPGRWPGHRPAAQVDQEGRPHGRLRPRGPPDLGRDHGVPEDDAALRPPPGGRRRGDREGPGRHPRRPAQADGHRDRAVRAHHRRRPAAARQPVARRPLRHAAGPAPSTCCRSTRASRRCSCTWGSARCCGSPRTSTSRPPPA